MEGAAVQAQQPGEVDQRRGIQLDHIGHIVQPPHPRRARQKVKAVQIVVGDNAAGARLDAALDVQKHLFGTHQIDGFAQDADTLLGSALLPERATFTRPPVGRGGGEIDSERFLIHGLAIDAASQHVVFGCG
ncbi:hypothetical protein D3C80_1046430 [compost metagenome]